MDETRTETPLIEAEQDAGPGAAPRPDRRALSRVVLLGIIGGTLAVVAAGRDWASATGGQAPMALKVTASGSDLSGAVSALGLAGLAGALALLATVRFGRQLVGLLMTAAGIGVIATAITVSGASHATTVLSDKAAAKGVGSAVTGVSTTSWSYLAILAGVVIALAGLTTVLRGRAWPGMSNRYEAPAAKEARAAATIREQAGTPKGLWDALDRGEDPTSRDD